MERRQLVLKAAVGFLLLGGGFLLIAELLVFPAAHTLEELRGQTRAWGALYALVGAVVLLGLLAGSVRQHSAQAVEHGRALVDLQRRSFAALQVAAVAHEGGDLLLAQRFRVAELARLHASDTASQPALRELERFCDDLERLLGRLRRLGAAVAREPAPLGQTLEEIVRTLRLHPAVRACALELESEGPWPEQPVARGPLEQLVVNLVLDAARSTGGSGRIDLRVSVAPHQVQLEVDDDGPAMTKERWASGRRPFAGTVLGVADLGLWAAHCCAEELGGELRQGSSRHGGACVVLRLPVGPAAPQGGGPQIGAPAGERQVQQPTA